MRHKWRRAVAARKWNADAALAEGELVCIFPEGALTKDGAMAPFKSGVEKILARRPVPVVPIALKNMWGSMWSRRANAKEGDLLARMRVPQRLRAHVDVVADAPVEGSTATAGSLEAKVRSLRGDAA